MGQYPQQVEPRVAAAELEGVERLEPQRRLLHRELLQPPRLPEAQPRQHPQPRQDEAPAAVLRQRPETPTVLPIGPEMQIIPPEFSSWRAVTLSA